jgi:hypothetical protein
MVTYIYMLVLTLLELLVLTLLAAGTHFTCINVTKLQITDAAPAAERVGKCSKKLGCSCCMLCCTIRNRALQLLQQSLPCNSCNRALQQLQQSMPCNSCNRAFLLCCSCCAISMLCCSCCTYQLCCNRAAERVAKRAATSTHVSTYYQMHVLILRCMRPHTTG